MEESLHFSTYLTNVDAKMTKMKRHNTANIYDYEGIRNSLTSSDFNCGGWGSLLHLQYKYTLSCYKLLQIFPPKHLWRIHQPSGLFFQYISSRSVYFYLKYYELFFIVKVEGVPSQQLKRSISLPHDVIVNILPQKMDLATHHRILSCNV